MWHRIWIPICQLCVYIYIPTYNICCHSFWHSIWHFFWHLIRHLFCSIPFRYATCPREQGLIVYVSGGPHARLGGKNILKKTSKVKEKSTTWWLIPRIVSGLVHPSYKWINPTYPIYNWGYNPQPRAVGSSPPSRNIQEARWCQHSVHRRSLVAMDKIHGWRNFYGYPMGFFHGDPRPGKFTKNYGKKSPCYQNHHWKSCVNPLFRLGHFQ